jgi:hypothetical protein
MSALNFRLESLVSSNTVSVPTVEFLGNVSSALTATDAIEVAAARAATGTNIGVVEIGIPLKAWDGMMCIQFADLDPDATFSNANADPKFINVADTYNTQQMKLEGDDTSTAYSSIDKVSAPAFSDRIQWDSTQNISTMFEEANEGGKADVCTTAISGQVVEGTNIATQFVQKQALNIFGDLEMAQLFANEATMHGEVTTALASVKAEQTNLANQACATDASGESYDHDAPNSLAASTLVASQFGLLFLTNTTLRTRLDARILAAINRVNSATACIENVFHKTGNGTADSTLGAVVCKLTNGNYLVPLPFIAGDTFTYDVTFDTNTATVFTNASGTAKAGLKCHMTYVVTLGAN